MKILKKNTYWMFLFLMAVIVTSCNEDDNEPADTEAPVITLVGEDTVDLTVGDSFTDPGATATDNVDGDISDEIEIAGDEVDTNTVGTYIITYNVSDEAENDAAEVTRTVNVLAEPDTEAPVITLEGDETINLTVGDSFSDPGATATDDVDGDISADIEIGGDEVDTETAGTYEITYNVSDEAGNAATEVIRTVIVSDPNDENDPNNIATNGNFENGEEGWLFFENGGIAELDNTLSNGGSNSAKVATSGPSNPGIKQERIGIGTVEAGDVVQIQFDHIGSVTEPGAVFNVLLFVERAEGEAGDPITHIFDPRPTLSDSWSTFTATYTIPNDASVTGGISFLIESVCGGDAGCEVSANVDNVSVTLNP